MDYRKLMEFYRDKRVLVTGHTGFKGSWMCRVLSLAGAQVCGYSLEPQTEPALFDLVGIAGNENIRTVIGDIRDYDSLKAVFDEFKPEIVIHMAAQPIVRESYKEPRYTFETNVMGTVNVCECVRLSKAGDDEDYEGVRSFLNVTTDKVYLNKERGKRGYKETDALDGYDPYSNSKSCSELVTHSYMNSFLAEEGIAVSTARAGNVVGGGDFAKDRIVPDCVKAAMDGREIIVRNPYSIRPYQHVLEPVFAYLMIAKEQYDNIELAGWYNVGPDDKDCIKTGHLVRIFTDCWDSAKWKSGTEKKPPHEAEFLRLNCDRIKSTFGWRPVWSIDKAIEKTVEFSQLIEKRRGRGVQPQLIECMDKQIDEFINDAKDAENEQ